MTKTSLAGLAATSLAALLGIVIHRAATDAGAPTLPALPTFSVEEPPPAPAVDPLRQRFWEEAAPQVEACQAAIEKELNLLVLAPVNQFFDAGAGRSPFFADHLLSFSGKWKFMKTRFDGGDRAYHDWVSEQVQERLINFEDLEKLLELRIARYIQEIEAQENALLLTLEHDLLSRPEFAGFAFPSGASLHDAFDTRTATLAKTVGKDFSYDVGGFVATEIAAIVIARVATKMLVSGGILSTGAALSPESLGITILAAIAIDAVVSTILNHVSGAKNEIALQLKSTLYEMRNEVAWGSADVEEDGLLWELRLLSRERAAIRSRAIEELILHPPS